MGWAAASAEGAEGGVVLVRRAPYLTSTCSASLPSSSLQHAGLRQHDKPRSDMLVQDSKQHGMTFQQQKQRRWTAERVAMTVVDRLPACGAWGSRGGTNAIVMVALDPGCRPQPLTPFPLPPPPRPLFFATHFCRTRLTAVMPNLSV